VSSHLLREHAPITEKGWRLIDEEAQQRLEPGLAARRLVDFSGPLGWEYSATNLGRVEPVARDDSDGIRALRRIVAPLVELRAPFSVARVELRAGDRGAEDVDFDDLDRAALALACAENAAVFHGWPEAGVEGIAERSTHPPIHRDDDFARYPSHTARAVELMLRSGIGGPYGLALSREDYTRVVETTEHGGYLLLDHLRRILGGPIVWAPGIAGAVVVSLRGGDFLFESGQDLSVGYEDHDSETVQLYIEESFSFRVVTPEAAVAIVPPA
jgi:uncharacterized linocin/CFP29 family protein